MTKQQKEVTQEIVYYSKTLTLKATSKTSHVAGNDDDWYNGTRGLVGASVLVISIP